MDLDEDVPAPPENAWNLPGLGGAAPLQHCGDEDRLPAGFGQGQPSWLAADADRLPASPGSEAPRTPTRRPAVVSPWTPPERKSLCAEMEEALREDSPPLLQMALLRTRG